MQIDVCDYVAEALCYVARLNKAAVVVEEYRKLGLYHLAHMEAFDAQIYAAEWRFRKEEARRPADVQELELRRVRLSALCKRFDDYKREYDSEWCMELPVCISCGHVVLGSLDPVPRPNKTFFAACSSIQT